MANTHRQARAIGEMNDGTRRKKVPAHWWDIVESQQAIARFDQATPTDEHTWRLVPMVVKPKMAAPPPPPPPPLVKVAPTPPPKPAPVAPPPKATVAKAPAVQPTDAKPPKPPKADVAGMVAAVVAVDRKPGRRTVDPRLPPIGAIQKFTHPKSGVVYTWKVVNDRGNVVLSGGNIAGEQFSSVSSAAAKINNGTSTNGYLFFGLGKKA